MGKSNWNKIAPWYDSLVGSQGHKYHQEYAIPTVLDLLDIQKNEKILDLGCGQGALAPQVNEKDGFYYGLDVGRNMIGLAIQRHKKDGKFLVGSATQIDQIISLKGIIFDSIVFMLSIQDMDPLDKIISQSAKVLKTGGKMVIFMMHPSFRIPRQSGWGEDKKRKLVYRRIDRYLTEETIPLNTNLSVTSYFYHRPLQRYFKEFGKNNLSVDRFLEIPEKKSGYEEFPTFLAMRVIKIS